MPVKTPLSPWRCKRLLRALKLKARLSAALLVAGVFSLSRPRAGWARIAAAFKVWTRFAADPRRAPRWIYYGRVRACLRCPMLYKPLRTCGSPLAKELRDLGCWCHVEHMASVAAEDCWYREQGGDDQFGWGDPLRRLRPME